MKRTAYHFLKEDMTAQYGCEPAWTIGEQRTLKGGTITPCNFGYHASPSVFDALTYAPGPTLCRVKLSGRSIAEHGEPVDKYAARSRRLIAAKDVSRELRLFAADCAEHVLCLFERERPGDDRPRKAIATARAFANGEATARDLDAASAAAKAAARDAERQWQRDRAAFYFDDIFKVLK